MIYYTTMNSILRFIISGISGSLCFLFVCLVYLLLGGCAGQLAVCRGGAGVTRLMSWTETGGNES